MKRSKTKDKTFRKILIANRGEIAVRIIRACRELGITPVAIFSEADRSSLHVKLADQAFEVGPPEASHSYLNQERIIQIAKGCGAEAIHPGYGFLAENPEFAAKVAGAGLVFIGPPAKAMRLLGDKIEARKLARNEGIPVLVGSEIATSFEQAVKEAPKIGYPVVLKAAAGGGGKGMRVVNSDREISEALRGAKHEALYAFGDDRIYLEKFLKAPRHIEIQILADRFGNCVHLGERECSVQRRHQKLIEESPSCAVTPKLREKLGQAAVKIAKATGYVNAGTVEFLLDGRNDFYFLEVNARLQVEHPVTELVTGLDLAKWQIAIAAGAKLTFKQKDIKPNGWAMECRIYAEDYQNNFYPSSGRLTEYREPGGPGVRVDSGVIKNSEVSLYYDPLISKLVTWGKDRAEAIARMKRALQEYKISGVVNTIPFHIKVFENPRFLSGKLSTDFISREFDPRKNWKAQTSKLEFAAATSAVVSYWNDRHFSTNLRLTNVRKSNWKENAKRVGLRSSL